MDAKRFDELGRALCHWSSRRLLFARLAALTAPLLPFALADDTLAKNKKKKRKKKHQKHKKQEPTCSPACTGAQVCQNGVCGCPSDTEECGGECRNLCPADSARNSFTCGCCRLSGQSPCFASSHCCSGDCIIMGSGICAGRPAGEECTFDAQCISGNCNGFCGN